MQIIHLHQIKDALAEIDMNQAMEDAFAAYSAGRAVVPPVGELLLEKGEVHIKYGYIKKKEFFVIKIASGFYENAALGLSSGNGLMLLFKQETGEIAAILLDEGHLTDVRTAAAGAVAAKYCAPKNVERIGIVGTGVQGRLQLLHLKAVTTCRDVLVWGRGDDQIAQYKEEMTEHGFKVETTRDAAEILASCNLIVTTTPSKTPLLDGNSIVEGTHITAVGSDTSKKQELDSMILARANLVVADSISQCLERGEIYKALSAGVIEEDSVVELGDIIAGKSDGRLNDSQITVADLTGVAVQDIKIAEAVYRKLGTR
ncbi:MAG: ornithine cyclodeaminase family protein [Acidobacteriota bacterium]|nr:ornithine cyclodeaminase family protein [Acidobacteriota bacterium]MDH3530399.1 ornithine cyclodeaminase family protein [Acidobacteriota bacterium]